MHQDGEGTLIIHGENESAAEISVSPASLIGVTERCNAFFTSTDDESQTMFVIANWKFGAIMGGILSCLTALYVVGYSIELVKRVLFRRR